MKPENTGAEKRPSSFRDDLLLYALVAGGIIVVIVALIVVFGPRFS